VDQEKKKEKRKEKEKSLPLNTEQGLSLNPGSTSYQCVPKLPQKSIFSSVN
jgi:hypothetical protein